MNNETSAKFIAELINGGEFYDKRWYTEEQRDLWRGHAAKIGEAFAVDIESMADNPSEIRLHMGEMTAQEMRSVVAAMKWIAASIRTSG